MDSYIHSRSINDQAQPRMLESSDSGIGDLQAEKRLSFQSEMIFEEVIHLENAPSTRPPPLARRVFIARKSCPLIGQTDELIGLRENLPKNIREAFRGYGVCNEPQETEEATETAEFSNHILQHKLRHVWFDASGVAQNKSREDVFTMRAGVRFSKVPKLFGQFRAQ